MYIAWMVDILVGKVLRPTRYQPAKLYKLLHQRGTVQFESRLVPNADVTDLDNDQVMSYAQAVGNIPDS